VRAFTAMRDALRATGRRIVYSINPTVSVDPTPGSAYDWSAIADMTRNSIDLVPLWHNTNPPPQGFLGVSEQLAAATPLAARSRPGHWKDPDMLVVGIPWDQFVAGHPGMLAGLAVPATLTAEQLEQAAAGQPSPQLAAMVGAQRPSLTQVEQRSHFSLWSMLAAPLLAGNDIRSMPAQTRAVLTNPEVIAVDQDPLVAAANPLPGDGRILVRPLADGSVAVALFNPGAQPASIETTAAAIGLGARPCYTVHDLWAHTDKATTGDIAAAAIPAHGVFAARVRPGCR
jgi:alpha-galactosidase